MLDVLALTLFTLYGMVALLGFHAAVTARGWRRLIGIPFIVAGGIAALLLAWMSSKYWFGDSQISEPFIDVSLRTVAVRTSLTILGLACGVALGFLIFALRGRLAKRGRPMLALALPILLLAATGALGTRVLVDVTRRRYPPVDERAVGEVKTLPGFRAGAYSREGPKNPTNIEMGDDGILYAAGYDGTIWSLPDRDRDGRAEGATQWASGFVEPVGLAWRNATLFVASKGRITALRDLDGDGRAEDARVVGSDLPAGLFAWHANNDMAFGPDGRMYFGIGSTSDNEAPTLPLAATIVSIDPAGGKPEIVATGVRNAFDVAFNAAGDLFSTDNGPAEYDPSPPDELNQILPHGYYGYPREYGIPAFGSKTIGPIILFPPHAAPTGITFYGGTSFPPGYQDNAFVTLWMRGEVSRVQLARLPAGGYIGKETTFASNMLNPIDVAIAPDGSLLVADFRTGVIHRISADVTPAPTP